jgi:DDE family transposase
MTWCEHNRVGYIFGLAGNQILSSNVAALAEDAAVARALGEAEKVRRFGDFRYAAKSWKVERKVVARIEASAQGTDTRFIVTNLAGAPRWLYESVYCARSQAEKSGQGAQAVPRFRSDLLHQRDGQTVPPPDPHRRLLAPAHAAWSGAEDLVLARRPVRHHPPRPDQGGPAVLLSAPDELGSPRRSGDRAATLIHGATCPDPNPSLPPPSPDYPRRWRRRHRCPETRRIAALMNDPGFRNGPLDVKSPSDGRGAGFMLPFVVGV